jgi:hypothetical protein
MFQSILKWSESYALQNEKSIAEWSESYQGSIIARSSSTLQIGCPNLKMVAIVKLRSMPKSIV